MAGVVLFLMIWLAVSADNTISVNTTKGVIDFLEARIDSNYNRRGRPGLDKAGPLDVFININVNDISYISEAQMEYSMTLFLRQIWIDERLSYAETGYKGVITLDYNAFDRIWTPDLYFVNLKSGVFHKITVPNRRFKLSPNGQVYFSQRHTVTLYCDMILDRFPMDNQTCFVEFSSYAYPTDDLVFHWRTDAVSVEMTRVSLPQYTITNITTVVCNPTIQGPVEGAFTCLRAYFHLSRRLKMYILNTYLPSFLVVFLSWLSFYIDPGSTPARTALGTITILVITTQNSGLINTVAYGTATNARDIWMAICLVFVFGAFIEYTAVNFLACRQKHRKVEDISCKANENKGGKDVESLNVRRRGFWSLFDFKRDPAMALERASRILFPFTFFVFCLFYWPAYLL